MEAILTIFLVIGIVYWIFRGTSWLSKGIIKVILIIPLIIATPFITSYRDWKTKPKKAKFLLTVVVINYILWTLLVILMML
jgi:predicted cobalt transporter CbtA